MENQSPIEDLKEILKKEVNKSAIDQAIEDYQRWATNLKEDKKEITHLLYLLKAAEQRSGNSSLKHNKRISEIILKKADIPNLDRRQSQEEYSLTLLQKGINKKYQIEMEFQTPKGAKIRKSITEPTM
jgi:hypothetical protein